MILGEYGKMVILAAILCGLLVFLFSKNQAGYMGLISSAKPERTLGQADTFVLAESILSRKSPGLSVKVRKLRRGESVDLLNRKELQIAAKNEEGEPVSLSVIKITDTKEQEITQEVNPGCFVPKTSGTYHVTYRAEEEFCGSIKRTEKEYRFLAD